ncbi:hypothetical protein BP5796_03491 [Coleophoma crateriformis]|uniref:ATP synthase subunit g n=1 Tax=Coleophoma crateriformis TaxID=565419 RepID=A0A3D8SNA1_9HELO|nr:hypothetical protein BP5796_03491 [Coleophoma crateriformis]
MSLSISRAALRQTTKLPGRSARRFESTTAKATEAAKDTASKASSKASEAASNFQSKASEGLTRVASTAGPAIAGAAKGVGNALGKIGGRTGRFIAFVERQIPPAVYYSRVGLELAKLVFKGQKMSPPPVTTFQSYFQLALKQLRNPSQLFQAASKTAESTSAGGVVARLRNLNQAQLVSGGVVFAEMLGFFTVGEIIGRMKLVGYRGDTGAHH